MARTLVGTPDPAPQPPMRVSTGNYTTTNSGMPHAYVVSYSYVETAIGRLFDETTLYGTRSAESRPELWDGNTIEGEVED